MSHNVTLRRPPPSLTCDVINGCSLTYFPENEKTDPESVISYHKRNNEIISGDEIAQDDDDDDYQYQHEYDDVANSPILQAEERLKSTRGNE